MFWGAFERSERVKAAGRVARLAAPDADDDLVALDTETTSLNRRTADLVAIGAVRVRGARILTSQRLSLLVKPREAMAATSIAVHGLRVIDAARGLPVETALERLVAFIGARPIVGYFLEFDLAVINRALQSYAAVRLTNRVIEVSSLYYDDRIRRGPYHVSTGEVDLSFDAIASELRLPRWRKHDPVNDAVMAALMYLKLRQRRN
jgi:DNA polymerase-3 subunit epsilon